MWWYRLVVKSTGYRTVRRICQGLCFKPAKVQPRVGSLLDSQPTVSSFSLTGA